jgi:hypothetical protein
MTTPSISIKESDVKASEVLIPAAKSSGWMAWYSINRNSAGAHYWSQAPCPYDPGTTRDPWRCPYPLFETRDAAIESCAKSLANGGTIRVVRIDL